jgi:hypothetical protein
VGNPLTQADSQNHRCRRLAGGQVYQASLRPNALRAKPIISYSSYQQMTNPDTWFDKIADHDAAIA